MENLDNIVPSNVANSESEHLVEVEKKEQLHYDDLSPEQLKIVDNFYREVIMSGKEETLAAFVNIPLELQTAVVERFIKKNSTRHMTEVRFVLNNLDKFGALDYVELADALGGEYIFDPANEVLDKFPDHNALLMHFLSIEEAGSAQNYGQSNFLKFLAKRIKDLRDINLEPLMPKFFNLLANSYFAEQATNILKVILEDQGENFKILNYVLDAAKINPKILSLTYLWERCKNELEEKESISLSELEVFMSANDLVIIDWLWRHQEKLKEIEPEKLAAMFLPILEGRKGIAESLLEFQNPEKYKELQERRLAKHPAPRRRKKRPDQPLFFGAETNIMLYEEIKFPAELEKILANFSDLNEQELLNSLLETKPTFILNHLELFSNIDLEVKQKILTSLMENEDDIKFLLNQFDFFKEFHNEKLALQLVEARENRAEFVLDHLANFSDLDHTRLVQVFIDKNYINLLDRRYKELNLGLEPQVLEEKLKKHVLRFSEYFLIKDILESPDLEPEESAKQIFLRLKEKSTYWQDEDNIIQPFEDGAQYFGYEKMWEYVSKPKLSRHDALHNFPAILNLSQASGLEAKQFFYQILSQVKKDESSYYEGTSHHHLNMIANNISLDIAKVLAEAGNYQDIPAMQQALEGIEAPADVFSSWKSLKKYADIFQLLKRKEILDELVELKKTGQVELFNYVEKLAFHPNVDLKAVMQFWRQPDEFLDVEEIHDASSHERKKPSHYTHIPNLDLTAEDLRDALVEGHYDSMQAFQPLGIEYVVRDLSSGDLSQLIKQALGSRSQGILGQARDPKKLFAEFNTILKKQNSNLNAYLQMNSEAEFQLDEKTEQDLVNKLFDQQIGLAVKTKKYRAQVHLKSDPEAVVAGNDTSCCMPFGSGKNNVYTFNPITSLFTVQVETEDGHWRTVAQSVLTRDKDIGVQVDELINRLDSEHTNLNELIPEDILRKSQGIVTCDNVELAKNFVDVNFGPVIEDIYRDFFQEYTAHFAQTDDLDAQRVIIGTGYSDSLTHLPRTANHFVPEAPVGYSDNVHAESLVLNLKVQENLRLAHRAINMRTKLKAEQFVDTMAQQAVLPKGVDYLTFRDSLSVAYIEGKAYHDNQTLMQYLHNMENALIAKDVSNTFKNRPNMSLQHRDAEGKTHAYILAYEGKKDKDGEDLLYVADLASDGHARAGASLVLGFVELYKKNYLFKDDLKPIYAQLREQTSYKLVMNQLDKISKSMGIKFEVEELSTYEMGDDTMHEVILRPVKI